MCEGEVKQGEQLSALKRGKQSLSQPASQPVRQEASVPWGEEQERRRQKMPA